MRPTVLGLASLFLVLAALSLRGRPQELPAEGLVTLYAGDDLQSSFDFRSGRAGGQVMRGEIRLDAAQIAFDVFAPNRISFGFVQDELVAVQDLGAVYVPPQKQSRDRAFEFPLALFHTLFFDGVRFAYHGPGDDRHPFEEADRILAAFPPEAVRDVEPIVQHTYLVRVRRAGLGARDEFFKFQVVDLVPEQSLTIRWATLGVR